MVGQAIGLNLVSGVATYHDYALVNCVAVVVTGRAIRVLPHRKATGVSSM
jgi:hypothetical protein